VTAVFGRGQKSAPEPEHGRYYIELVDVKHFKNEKDRRAAQEALDKGAAKGWELVNASVRFSDFPLVLIWDTQPQNLRG
jgi:hypothetical protein